MSEPDTPKGIVAVLVDHDGREIANASDFAPFNPAGFTLREAQEQRARRALCGAVMRALAAPSLCDAIEPHIAERIVDAMRPKGFRVLIIPIGHDE